MSNVENFQRKKQDFMYTDSVIEFRPGRIFAENETQIWAEKKTKFLLYLY